MPVFFALAGGAAFTFHDAASLEESVLCPAPRAELHHALTHPGYYLGPDVVDE